MPLFKTGFRCQKEGYMYYFYFWQILLEEKEAKVMHVRVVLRR
jgi:hypothetical protein